MVLTLIACRLHHGADANAGKNDRVLSVDIPQQIRHPVSDHREIDALEAKPALTGRPRGRVDEFT